jgi:hypothetical protein
MPMDNICPRTIRLKKANKMDKSHYPDRITLVPNQKTANLTAINCNSEIVVYLNFLACRENKCPDEKDCDYHRNANAKKLICNITGDCAHIYIANEIANPQIKHYIIIFVEGIKIGRKDELIRVLCNTVNWLNISRERPHFYIFYYGPPAITNTLDYIRNYLDKNLKSELGNYNRNEYICKTSNINRHAQYLTISENNPINFVIG